MLEGTHRNGAMDRRRIRGACRESLRSWDIGCGLRSRFFQVPQRIESMHVCVNGGIGIPRVRLWEECRSTISSSPETGGDIIASTGMSRRKPHLQ